MIPRLTRVVCCVATGLTLLSGCSVSGPTAPAPSASSPTIDADRAFDDVVAKLTEQSVTVSLNVGGVFRAEGQVDTKAGKAKVLLTDVSVLFNRPTVEVIVLGNDIWIKPSAPYSGGWLHTTVKDARGTVLDFVDPSNPGGLLTMHKAINKIEYNGATRFAGTVDMTQSLAYPRDAISAGAKLSDAPFAASLIDGRISTFVVDMTAAVKHRAVVSASYSEYGKPFDVTAPDPSDVTDLTEELLPEFLGR